MCARILSTVRFINLFLALTVLVMVSGCRYEAYPEQQKFDVDTSVPLFSRQGVWGTVPTKEGVQWRVGLLFRPLPVLRVEREALCPEGVPMSRSINLLFPGRSLKRGYICAVLNETRGFIKYGINPHRVYFKGNLIGPEELQETWGFVHGLTLKEGVGFKGTPLKDRQPVNFNAPAEEYDPEKHAIPWDPKLVAE